MPAKKSRDDFSRATSMPERSNKNKIIQPDNRILIRPAISVGSVQNAPKPKCKYCGKYHPGECRSKMGACYKCGATDHFIRNCPQLQKKRRGRPKRKLSGYFPEK